MNEPKIIDNTQTTVVRYIGIEMCPMVCCREVNVVIQDGKIASVEFCGGCSGNTQGLSILLKGMNVSEAIEKLKGIDCGGKGTSCPDQLARGLEKVINTL